MGRSEAIYTEKTEPWPVQAPSITPNTSPGARELDHRLANSLQIAADFILFEQSRVADPAARDVLLTTANRLAAVGELHRYLCIQPDAEGAVAFDVFLQGLVGRIAGATGLASMVDADPLRLPAETAQPLAIIINEFAINAVKHAYEPGAPGALRIESHVVRDRLQLTVADEGRGLPPGFDPSRSRGLGMSIIQALTRQLGATLTADDDHGARFTVTLPLVRPSVPRSFAPRT